MCSSTQDMSPISQACWSPICPICPSNYSLSQRRGWILLIRVSWNILSKALWRWRCFLFLSVCSYLLLFSLQWCCRFCAHSSRSYPGSWGEEKFRRKPNFAASAPGAAAIWYHACGYREVAKCSPAILPCLRNERNILSKPREIQFSNQEKYVYQTVKTEQRGPENY